MSQVTVGQLCELFRQIAEERITGEMVQELIEEASEMGLSQTLRRVLQKARSLARESVAYDPFVGFWALALIAAVTRGEKDLNLARATAVGISDSPYPYNRARALTKIAEITRLPEDVELARKTVLQLPRDFHGDAVREVMAEVLAATKNFRATENMASEVSDAYWSEGAKAAVVRVLAELKDLESARKLASEISNSGWQAGALINIARASCRIKDLDSAHSVALKIQDDEPRDWRLTEIGKLFVEMDEPTRTLIVICEIKDDYWRGEVQAAHVKWLAHKDQIAARKEIAKIPNAYWRTRAMVALAIVTRDQKDFELARQTVPEIEIDHQRAKAAAFVTGNSGEAEDLNVLLRAVSGLSGHSWDRAETLAEIAEILTKATE